MELDSKPTETNIVLVNDKVLMTLLGSKGIGPVKLFMSGWPDGDPQEPKEPYAAYSQTDDVIQYIKEFEDNTALVNLNDYLLSAFELEGMTGKFTYWPKETKGVVNE